MDLLRLKRNGRKKNGNFFTWFDLHVSRLWFQNLQCLNSAKKIDNVSVPSEAPKIPDICWEMVPGIHVARFDQAMFYPGQVSKLRIICRLFGTNVIHRKFSWTQTSSWFWAEIIWCNGVSVAMLFVVATLPLTKACLQNMVCKEAWFVV